MQSEQKSPSESMVVSSNSNPMSESKPNFELESSNQEHPLGGGPLDEITPHHSPRAYGRLAVVLHWVLAALILYQLILGLWMIDLPKSPVGLRAGWFNWHKSVGLVIGLLMCFRLMWRLTHPVQADEIVLPRWQSLVSKMNHLCLYLCLLLMPLSGFLGSNFTPYPVKLFGWAIPRFLEPSAPLKAICSSVHEYTSCILLALISLHLLAALWHAIRKDGVVSRMGLPYGPEREKNQ